MSSRKRHRIDSDNIESNSDKWQSSKNSSWPDYVGCYSVLMSSLKETLVSDRIVDAAVNGLVEKYHTSEKESAYGFSMEDKVFEKEVNDYNNEYLDCLATGKAVPEAPKPNKSGIRWPKIDPNRVKMVILKNSPSIPNQAVFFIGYDS